MKNSQLIAVLKTLSKSEVREFRKWLQSPVHNQRDDVVQLFEYLCAGNHLEQDKFLEKQRVFRKIYGAQAYNDAKLRQANHFLSRNLEEYLAYQQWRQDDVRSRVPLLTQLRKRKLNKSFQRTNHQLEQAQEKQPYRTDRYYRNQYLIQLEAFTQASERQRTPENNLQLVSDTLDTTYLIEKLKLSCRMVFHQIVYKTDFNFGMLQHIIRFIEERDLTQTPVVAIYYYIFKAVTEQEKDQLYFEKLRHEIHTSGNLFTHSEQREVYLMVINYCIGKMNAGVQRFVREAFEWYRQGFENRILIENNLISRWTYLNTVFTALRLKEFEWSYRFIHEYESYIEPEFRENFSSFSKAKLLFEKKDYDSAMEYLVQVEYDDILINLNAKALLLKIYYEEDELDALESLIESMRIFLKRKKVMGYHKANFQNVIKYTRRLVRLNPFEKEKHKSLRNEIEKASPLHEKEWLLAKLDTI